MKPPIVEVDLPEIEIRLFGIFEVKAVADGRILSFLTRPTRWLFAYLVLLRGSMVEYSVLMEAIWPRQRSDKNRESNPDNDGATNSQLPNYEPTSVRTSLSNLYAVLHKRRFVKDLRNTIGIALPGLTVDVYAFDDAIEAAREADQRRTAAQRASGATARHRLDEATEAGLRRAIALYTGDLLPDCKQQWIQAKREQRRQDYLWALNRLKAHVQAGGDQLAAERYLRKLLAEEPYREETVTELMSLLMERGEPALAREIHTQYFALRPKPNPAPNSNIIRLFRILVSMPRSEEPIAALELPGDECAPIYGDACLPEPLIGRNAAAAEIATRLKLVRAVLLQGPPGVGKTQLALRVWHDARHNYPDGSAFVDLTVAHTQRDVLRHLTAQLRLKPGKTFSDEKALVAILAPRRFLLILDNCEHIAGGIASLVKNLLVKCPRLSLITTSQLAFRDIAPQFVYHVSALTVPDLEACRRAAETPALLLQYDAVQLYLREAAKTVPGIQLTPQNATAIGRICQTLDGLPLGITLAARMVLLHSPAETLAALLRDDRVLRSNQSGLPARQRSLWDAIDASYSLLPNELQRTFACLGVFQGGWTLAAATAVVDSHHLPDELMLLAGRSLITSVPLPDQARFRMLDTIRRYSETHLNLLPDKNQVRKRHMEFYLLFAEQRDRALRDQPPGSVFDAIEREERNLHAALEWSIASDAAEQGLRLATALGRYWFARGGNKTGTIWLDKMLALNPDALPMLHKQALRAAGNLAIQRGDYERARACYTRILELAGDRENTSDLFVAYANLGNCAMMTGDLTTAKSHYECFLAISREVGDELRTATALSYLANLAHQTGEFASACDHHIDAIALLRKTGNRQRLATVLNNYADTRIALNQLEAGAETLQESFALCREIDYRPGLTDCLFLHARLAQELGMMETAARFLGGAVALRDANGLALPPEAVAEQRQICSIIRAHIGTAALNAAMDASRSMSLSDHVARAGTVYDKIARLRWPDLPNHS